MGFLNGAVGILNWAWALWGWGAVGTPGGVCMGFLGGVCGNSGDRHRAGSVDFLNWAVECGLSERGCGLSELGCGLSERGLRAFWTGQWGIHTGIWQIKTGQWAFRTRLWAFSILICGF